MLRFFSSGLAIMAGVVCSSTPVSPYQTQASPAPDYRNDPRLTAIRAFFEKADCPAKYYSHVFLEAADDYKLDWRLLPSISFLESTGGKTAHFNNLFGWDSGRAHFSSPSAGIHAVGYQLGTSAYYKRKNLDQLLAAYNPAVQGYARRVKAVMSQIAARQ